MTLERINPASLGEPRGFNNGMLGPPGGRVLFVAGQTARDANGSIVGSGLVEQWEHALTSVVTIVKAAGGRTIDIGRMTIFLTDLDEYRRSLPDIGSVWISLMGKHFPAMSVVEVSRLVDEGALIEIEATAVIP